MDDIPVEVRARAARDRNFLASLMARGKVSRRRDSYSARHPDFISDIERRARAQRPPAHASGVNLAIRSKKVKRKRRK